MPRPALWNACLTDTEPTIMVRLGGPLGELDAQDQMSVTLTVHLLACPCSLRPVNKTDESKTFSTTSLSVFCEEDSCNTTKALEHVAKFLFFCHLGDLDNSLVSTQQGSRTAVDLRW